MSANKLFSEHLFAQKVLMVRPVDFAFNCQTGVDNEFQRRMALSPQETKSRALTEFANAVDKLQSVGVQVLVLEQGDSDFQVPDAVFPNNWFATDNKGNIRIFPMKTVNRQWEVRPDDVKALLIDNGLLVNDIQYVEAQTSSQVKSQVNAQPSVLEGTGAIVFDHQHKIAYAALSERCHLPLLKQFCESIDYTPFSFSTRSSEGNAIYHTNVLMSVGGDFVLACVDGIVKHDRDRFIAQVESTGKTLIMITHEQMESHYCGNILELSNNKGERVLALSENAWQGFNASQQAFFNERMVICANNIDTIETIGGGSMRCMLAEVFNPAN